ncbi:MAG TPA: DEAD/DEAH box helicase [Pirellulales bacterium]|nr:DEAD/DEAH box helicase [Pirellulales bacterium]
MYTTLPDVFHPIVAHWFKDRFGQPTEAQRLGWPEIASGRNTLIAAPTGSGKTLAAFMVAIDQLLRQSIEGTLADETQVVYVSPLKALSNDIHRNLEVPLAEIGRCAVESGHSLPALRVMVRTGDTPASQRQAMVKRPPQILVSTPESLYLLLTSAKGREMLRTVRTVIVDEIHALARDKRGSHLALSLERLAALCPRPPVRIGLSATQRPIDQIARFLVGSGDAGGEPECRIVDTGHVRLLDLEVEVPPSELSAVCSHETWDEIYRRLTELIGTHRSTLVFVNTRRLAERIGYKLSELLGADAVASHHGSLSRETRLSAERRLQTGELKAIVATASLELGIDVGYIDLVCQIGSPRSIATFLQRVGRSGHSLGALPCGRLFALTRDELLECLALIRAVRAGRLDPIEIPQAPLDILAQQMVAAVAAEECSEDGLFELVRKAWPYRALRRSDFDALLEMLSEGIARGRRQGAYLHRDRIHGRLRARRGARITALTCGGAIPDLADYRVITADDRTFVGTVNEDFAIESMAGDVFLLGNTSWRVRHVRGGEVVVDDAHAAPATIPFWLGEAPGRTIELSAEVSALREDLARQVRESAIAWLRGECGASAWAAEQASDYVAAQQAAIGLVPTQRKVVFERFFDESGGMQLVIHAPFGARINRAWGLALRKRFCRSFDFELQASADDDGIVLSLGPQHSFPIEQLFRMLNRENARNLLEQALLAVPMFQVRWRWNVTRALVVPRQRGGRRVPAHLQRFRADDLLAAVFPAQTACLENVVGDIQIPDHPLVNQTVHDCLQEAMDLERWLALLGDVEAGRVELIARDTREPSPFSYERLNANPYAFLDDAPLEERRARAVATRRSLSVENLGDLGRLDPEAIDRVRAEAWPTVRDADELHDALLSMVALPAGEGQAWAAWFDELSATGRATQVTLPAETPERTLWVAAERWPLVRALYPTAPAVPSPRLPPALDLVHETTAATLALVRGRLECRGPLTADEVSCDFELRLSAVEAALESLEGEGAVLRGRYTARTAGVEWCDRRLLARIHRLTLDGARRRVQPADPADFWRFLLAHQHLALGARLEGPVGLREVLGKLQGFETPAGAWERDLLPGRVSGYDPAWLDEMSLAGEIAWGRLQPPQRAEDDGPSSAGLTRVVPIALVTRADLDGLLPPERGNPERFARGDAKLVFDTLVAEGALFVRDLLASTGLLPGHLDMALGELAALGLVTADGFATVRSLVTADGGRKTGHRHGQHPRSGRYAGGGRWSRFPGRVRVVPQAERAELWAQQLARRYGVIFRDLLARETVAPAWRELADVYRRWEAQGRIRGGRFVSGVAGEQYAAPEVVERLRQTRETCSAGQWIVVSAADPLNLAGIIMPGPRIVANTRNALALLDGRLVASQQAGEVQFHEPLANALSDPIRRALLVTTLVRQRDVSSLNPEP